MFNFRIIDPPDGNQIIDPSIKTPYNALTPVQMVEYIEMDNQLAIMEKLKRERRTEAGCRKKFTSNPLLKLTGMCRLV